MASSWLAESGWFEAKDRFDSFQSIPAPLLPKWEKGLGDEGGSAICQLPLPRLPQHLVEICLAQLPN